MKDQIIRLKEGATTETLKLNENCFWYSSEKHDSIVKMQETVEKKDGGMLDYHGIVDYENISKIILNENSPKVEVQYINRKGKEKNISLLFESISQAHEIGISISEKNVNLEKVISTENKSQRLLFNLLYPVIAIAATLFIGLNDDIEVNETSFTKSARRARSGKAILRMIHEYIGQTGIFIIGGLVTIYFIYKALNRYNNPVNDIVYEKHK